jgi:polyisoprenoid-binding protein YceI
MFDEVLEQSFHPKILYKSSHVAASKTAENMFRLNLTGEPTLHGVNRGIGLDANVVIGEDALRAQGSFSLLQSDYGISAASVAGGSIKLKDELKFSYFILARRQQF